jgi:hypothetical protein
MSVLGILTCEILELEFVHLLDSDKDVERITVVQDGRSARLIEAFDSIKAENLNLIADLDAFTPAPDGRFEILIQVLELALHSRKKILQEGLIDAAGILSPHVDALLLGYGLCGNALEKPDELLSDAGVPIFIPMDEDHPVDDCVGLLIGGRECYYGEQCKVAGTFFMIPGWTYHWRRMFEHEFGKMTPEILNMMFEHYERSLMVTTPTMSLEQMRRNSAEFNKKFGFRTETRKGTLDILNETWDSAKMFVLSKTDSDGAKA